tara:strand:+ start:415 stop:612 length:198 start_codon:yes stop_codon:yes gene_type:complete
MIISKICNKHGYHKGSNCPECGKDFTENKKWTTNLYMRTERGKRTDIEFAQVPISEDVKNFKRRY